MLLPNLDSCGFEPDNDTLEPVAKRVCIDEGCDFELTVPATDDIPIVIEQTCSHEEVLLDLLDLQSHGLKVVLPNLDGTRIGTTSESSRGASVEVTNVLEHVTTFILQDWIDLAELGGVPEWPQGTSCNSVRLELSRRSRRAP